MRSNWSHSPPNFSVPFSSNRSKLNTKGGLRNMAPFNALYFCMKMRLMFTSVSITAKRETVRVLDFSWRMTEPHFLLQRAPADWHRAAAKASELCRTQWTTFGKPKTSSDLGAYIVPAEITWTYSPLYETIGKSRQRELAELITRSFWKCIRSRRLLGWMDLQKQKDFSGCFHVQNMES